MAPQHLAYVYAPNSACGNLLLSGIMKPSLPKLSPVGSEPALGSAGLATGKGRAAHIHINEPVGAYLLIIFFPFSAPSAIPPAFPSCLQVLSNWWARR